VDSPQTNECCGWPELGVCAHCPDPETVEWGKHNLPRPATVEGGHVIPICGSSATAFRALPAEAAGVKHGKFRAVWVGPYMLSWQWSPDGVWVHGGKRMPFFCLSRGCQDDSDVGGRTFKLGPLMVSIGWNVTA
jgi:hypothetical protein